MKIGFRWFKTVWTSIAWFVIWIILICNLHNKHRNNWWFVGEKLRTEHFIEARQLKLEKCIFILKVFSFHTWQKYQSFWYFHASVFITGTSAAEKHQYSRHRRSLRTPRDSTERSKSRHMQWLECLRGKSPQTGDRQDWTWFTDPAGDESAGRKTKDAQLEFIHSVTQRKCVFPDYKGKTDSITDSLSYRSKPFKHQTCLITLARVFLFFKGIRMIHNLDFLFHNYDVNFDW